MDEETQKENEGKAEEKTPQETVAENTTTEEKSVAEVPRSSTPILDDVKKAAERIEKANKKTEELLRKQADMITEASIAGRGYAGEVEVKKEDTPEEYSEKVMKGEINPFDVA